MKSLTRFCFFDEGEFTALYSAPPLRILLQQLKNEYGAANLYVYAHSHGNIVVSEALRLAAAAGTGQLVNTYVPSQAAVPVEAYDPSFTSNATYKMPFSTTYPWIELKSADVYGNFDAPNSDAVGTKVNFENVNDYALSYWAWQFDQMLKPDHGTGVYTPFSAINTSGNTSIPQVRWPYGYYGNVNGTVDNTTNYFYKSQKTYQPVGSHGGHAWLTVSNPLLSTAGKDSQGKPQLYEIFSFAAQPRTLALGDTSGNIAGFAGYQDLPSIWPSPDILGGNYDEHPWHSGQFRFNNVMQNQYWKTLLGTKGFDLLP